MGAKIRVLHVEVGGTYGGSLRALDVYLRYSDRGRFEHDLLLYYPTPGVERLRPSLGRVIVASRTRESAVSRRVTRGSALRQLGIARFPLLTDVHYLLNGLRVLPHLSRATDFSAYDVIHINNTFTYGAGGLLAGRRALKPIVVHARNSVQRNVFTRLLARRADCIVTIHAALEADFRAWEATLPVTTCYDPVEPPGVTASEVAAVRADLVPPGGVLIGSAGRLDSQKGFDDFIRAAAKVVTVHPNAYFAIVGDGPLRSSLEALIGELRLVSRFRVCAFREDIGAFMSALDVFVSSSRWEGLPLAIVEAMLLGVPVVATDVDGTPEVVIPGKTGTLVPAGSPDRLARELVALVEQPGAGKRYVSEARRVAAGLTDPSTRAREFDRIIDRLGGGVKLRTRQFYDRAYSDESWQRHAPALAPTGERFTKMWYRAFTDHVMPGLALSGKRTLEVGCGYGHLAPYVEGLGSQYIGVDLSHTAVLQVPEGRGGRSRGLVADGMQLPFEDSTFNVVICMEVLEHVTDPAAIVDECCRVVRPGGILVFSYPNYINLFIVPKLLADAGVPFFTQYLKRQIVDRTTTAFALRKLLRNRGVIRLQRGVRLHPPFLEQIDYRLSKRHLLRRINDGIFALESRWGDRFPLNLVGLHTLFVVDVPRGEQRR